MCGISGIYAKKLTAEHTHLLAAILHSQSARGPDYQASEKIQKTNNEILLGHNRLSIVDLSSHSNQPLWDTTGRYCISYNGEIYNYIELREELKAAHYKFNTMGDTEVILNAFAHWGIDALNRFHGPFAFALFDSKKNELWLCRDRFAIKPLYYTQRKNTLYFASTTAVLARHLSLEPNLSYLAKGLQYLVYEDDSAMSAYEKMFSVPAGSYLRARFSEAGELSIFVENYYKLAERVKMLIENLASSETSHLISSINERLEHAVKIRLRTDVPLAISLSGGLDSSSVAALVSKQHDNTVGFSFGHPDNQHSEGPIVAECAKFLNIKMEYVSPTASEMIAGFHQTMTAQDAPFPTLSIVAQYLLYQKVRANGVKVLLGGQGGDEAFMGYKKYMLFWLKQGIKNKDFLVTAKNLWQMAPMMIAELGAIKGYWQHRHRYMQSKGDPVSLLRLPLIPLLSLNNINQPLWQRQIQDITQFSLPTLLRYEDRNSMGNSVESRLPYMDHQLVELGLALPESLKLHAGYGKWVIRKIMQQQIPEKIRLARFKRGFDIPLSPLLKAGFGRSIRHQLQENKNVLKEFLPAHKNVNELYSDQQLTSRKHALGEAITLLWLNKVST